MKTQRTLQQTLNDCRFMLEASDIAVGEDFNQPFPTLRFAINDREQDVQNVADILSDQMRLKITGVCPVFTLDGNPNTESFAFRHVSENIGVVLVFANRAETNGTIVVMSDEKYENLCNLNSYMPN